jgi:hypothetical protein
MDTFDDLLVQEEQPQTRRRRREGSSALAGLFGLLLIVIGLVTCCAAVWFVLQFAWWLFLVFLEGAGMSTGNFQNPDYGNFVD